MCCLAEGGGELRSNFANSTDISNLANRISNETTARANADSGIKTMLTNETNARANEDSSITLALANEANARKATDPVFIDMSSYLTLDAEMPVTEFNSLALYIQNKKNIIGYVSTTTSSIEMFYINATYNIISSYVKRINLKFLCNSHIYYIVIMCITSITQTTKCSVTQCRAIYFASTNTSLSYNDSSTYITLCNTQLVWDQLNTMTTYYYSSSTTASITLSHDSKHRICILAYGGKRVNIYLPTSNLIDGETFQIYCTCYTTTDTSCKWYIFADSSSIYIYYNGERKDSYNISTMSNKIFTCIYNSGASGWQLFF